MSVSVAEIISFLAQEGIEAVCSSEIQSHQIQQISSLSQADSNQISFFTDPRRKAELANSQAGLVIIQPNFKHLTTLPTLEVEDPYYVYAKIAQFLNPSDWSAGIEELAVVSPSAIIDPTASVAALAYIGDKVVVGEKTRISPNAVIEEGVCIGQNCYIGPNVTVMKFCQIGDDVTIEAGTVIGGDGFGWAPHQGRWEKIPQIGQVIIEDRVSIGNNCTIDRGAIENTVIQQGTIIDNLVHIAHNVTVGDACAIAGQTGISGSTEVGNHCIFAGQVGVAGHLSLSSNTVFMAKSGVTHNIKSPGSYSGFPAIPTADWQKSTVLQKKLVKMNSQLKSLQKQMDELTQKMESE